MNYHGNDVITIVSLEQLSSFWTSTGHIICLSGVPFVDIDRDMDQHVNTPDKYILLSH